MASAYNLDDAAKTATTSLTSIAGGSGWSPIYLTAVLADVEACRTASDGWFSSDATELEAFWLALWEKWRTWDQSLDGMVDVGEWLAGENQNVESRAATADAQSWGTIAAGTAQGSLDDVGEVVETAAKVAETAQGIAKSQIAWYIGGVALIAFVAYRLTNK